MTKNYEYFINEPEGVADASIIWLHGLGADGRDFAGIVEELALPLNHKVRFIFPSAPFENITINQGMRMRAWYDIYNLNLLKKEDAIGAKKSQEFLNDLIQREIDQGIVSRRIILGGFSQGGAISLYAGLRSAQPLGGIICLSAYLLLKGTLPAEGSNANLKTPIFIAHGMFDPIVQYNLGQEAHNLLEQAHYNTEWHSYPMEHTLCLEEIAAIGSFIKRCLGYA